MKILTLTLLLISCSRVTPVQVVDSDTSLVRAKLTELEGKAESLADDNGWLVSKSCDSMLWSGKACLSNTNMNAAEIVGKYFRTPTKSCYLEKRSGSTTSRDMSLGTLNCLLEKQDLAAIERHIEYGNDNGWKMGEGAATRIYYSPALIGLWYKAARVLGHDYGYYETPNVYPSGLIDYQAHLQTLFIHLVGKLDGHISKNSRDRLEEHSSRIDNSPSYAAIHAQYGGSIDSAISLCLDTNNIVGDYVRCDGEACELAERIFACKILLETLDGVKT